MTPPVATETPADALAFRLPGELIARAPIEARGGRRDDARMLVSWRSRPDLVDSTVRDLPAFLRAGDVVVVNTSATLPAAVPTADGRLLHLSTELPGRLWVVELRRPAGAGSLPLPGVAAGAVPLPGAGRADLLAPFPADGRAESRLWVAALSLPTALGAYLAEFGRPIRYGADPGAWPLSTYQTIFASRPGSAEMASAARPFTAELLAALDQAGVVVVPITLHTGVSSQEAWEPPYPERYDVPADTADVVNLARACGGRVVAVGTTVARALETVAGAGGLVHPGAGWTEHVIGPGEGVQVIDGMLTGWHEPEASHLRLLEAVGGRRLLARSYAHALDHRYLWHQFGDVHLILP